MELSVADETWPIRSAFTISRGAKTEARVVVASISDGKYQGRGECVPYSRYGETVESVQKQIESVRSVLEKGITKDELQKVLPAGAARNALDCALWDLECKKEGMIIWQLLAIEPRPKPTAYTVSLDSAEKMTASASRAAKEYSMLKIKLGAEGDAERIQKVREAVPEVRLIVDANEGWNTQNLGSMIRACEQAGVELIEQPVPLSHSNVLKNIRTSCIICVDESAHTSEDIPKLAGVYQAVNIKLDKAGGLTEALAMAMKAKEAGLKIMVGCMVSTSLSMAPATIVAQYADYVDLDGPLLLAKDREPTTLYQDGMILPTTLELWG